MLSRGFADMWHGRPSFNQKMQFHKDACEFAHIFIHMYVGFFLNEGWVSTFHLIFRWLETVNWGKCYISETFFVDFYTRPLKSQTHLVTPRIPLLPEGASLEGCSKVKVGDTCSNSWFMMIGKDTMSLNIVSQLCKVDFWIMLDMWFLLQKTSTDCMHETCAYFLGEVIVRNMPWFSRYLGVWVKC